MQTSHDETKMQRTICPGCGNEVTHIHVFVVEENKYDCYITDKELDKEQQIEWDFDSIVDGTEKTMQAECDCGCLLGKWHRTSYSETWKKAIGVIHFDDWIKAILLEEAE